MSDETTVMTQPDSFGRHWVYVTEAIAKGVLVWLFG